MPLSATGSWKGLEVEGHYGLLMGFGQTMPEAVR